MARDTAVNIELKLHSDVQVFADEWSGISDPIVRRKVQNRLNKRASRRRKAAQQKGEEHDSAAELASERQGIARINEAAGLSYLLALHAAASTTNATNDWLDAPVSQTMVVGSQKAPPRQEKSKQAHLELLMRRRLGDLESWCVAVLERADHNALYPLGADQLLTLVYYNVMRALTANIHVLGLDIELMFMDEYQSPFTTRPWDSTELSLIPRNFRPTYVQATTPHHPQWDIFPDPVLRDNVLLCGEENVDDVELCLDIIGDGLFNAGDDTKSQTGMIVWGEPHDIMAWEVTERFAVKYAWFLIGANVLQMSTNEWRRRRGEDPLTFA